MSMMFLMYSDTTVCDVVFVKTLVAWSIPVEGGRNFVRVTVSMTVEGVVLQNIASEYVHSHPGLPPARLITDLCICVLLFPRLCLVV